MANTDDVSQLVDNDELDRDLQPHLGHLHVRGKADAGFFDNEALDDRTESQNGVESHNHNNSSQNPSYTGNESPNDESSKNHKANVNGHAVSESSVTVEVPQNGVTAPPVYYSNRSGDATVVNEPVIVRRSDGTAEIQTQQCCALAPHRHVAERPLRIRHIKLLKGFSIMAIFIFFPLGIPAMYFAYKTEKAFNEGVNQGNIDKARKLAKRTERLIIFSVMAALLVAVAVFAVVERHLMADDEEYWKSKASGAIMPTG